MDAAIHVEALSKRFGRLEVLREVTCAVAEGEVVCIIGPSGSGKSTLLRCMNGLETATSGDVFVNGVAVHDPQTNLDLLRADIGMVFQRFNLFPHMTALENVMEAPRQVRRVARAEAERLAREQLERVGLSDRADHYPSQLSGGQQQRVAIARAVATDPELLLLDEITSALDPHLIGEVLDLVGELKDAGSTILMATHEIGFARRCADRVIFLKDGLVHEEGPAAQVLEDPQEPATREFLHRVLH